MSRSNKTRRRIGMVLFMAVLSVLFTAVVSSVHLATRDLVARNRSSFRKRSVLYAAGVSVPESPGEVSRLFEKQVRAVERDDTIQYYRVQQKDGSKVFVLLRSGPGLWGEIRAHIGLRGDLETMAGIDFIQQNETPGLGARISEDWFREQFRGKTGPFTTVPEGTENNDRNEFDAVTGATVTSQAVKKIINAALQSAPETVKTEEN